MYFFVNCVFLKWSAPYLKELLLLQDKEPVPVQDYESKKKLEVRRLESMLVRMLTEKLNTGNQGKVI